MRDSYVLSVVLAVIVATIITRFIILLLPTKYSKARILQEFNRFFPATILALLIIYSVKDAQWSIKALGSADFAYAEILGIGGNGTGTCRAGAESACKHYRRHCRVYAGAIFVIAVVARDITILII